MRAWIIRGGEGGEAVDRFIDESIIGLGYGEVPDLEKVDRWDIKTALDNAGYSNPEAHADTLIAFLHEMVNGDGVFMSDPNHGDVVVGVIDGPYNCASYLETHEYRHRRKVRWIARHDRSALPVVLNDTARQRSVLRRVDSPSIRTHIDALESGALGRPATQRSAPRAPRVPGSASGSASRPRRSSASSPKKPVIATRRCDGCYQTKPVTQFDGDETLCRDCA